MNKGMKITITGAFALAAVLLLGHQAAFAGIGSQACSACHTMHNSQDGGNMVSASDPFIADASVPQNYLLMFSCLGCHTSDNGGSTPLADTGAPAVHHTGTDPRAGGAGNSYNAGGSFYYVVTDMDKGHNVNGIGLQTGPLAADAPGDAYLGGSFPVVAGDKLDCITGSGFTGCHISNAHHDNAGSNDVTDTAGDVTWVDGSTAGSSYRFLSGRIKGGEHSHWEHPIAPVDADNHNIYFSSGNYLDPGSNTITSFCTKCHGDFHGQADATLPVGGVSGGTPGSSPWVRHPTDLGLSTRSGAEYALYTVYDPIVPVGTSDYTATANNADMEALLDGVVDATYDFVLCQSCHRAHGSEEKDMLRFSYDKMRAGDAVAQGSVGTGCFVCHGGKE